MTQVQHHVRLHVLYTFQFRDISRWLQRADTRMPLSSSSRTTHSLWYAVLSATDAVRMHVQEEPSISLWLSMRSRSSLLPLTFDILSREEYKGLRGIIHCFSYSYELAMEYVKMGYYIGIGGVVTFKNGRKLHEIAERIPIENIVVETDCPYLAPEPYRGRRNSSAYLTYIIERIARLRSMTYEEVEKATYENAAALYGVRADG